MGTITSSSPRTKTSRLSSNGLPNELERDDAISSKTGHQSTVSTTFTQGRPDSEGALGAHDCLSPFAQSILELKDTVILPISRTFNIWTTIMFLSTGYFVFIVPFQLALEYDIVASSNSAN